MQALWILASGLRLRGRDASRSRGRPAAAWLAVSLVAALGAASPAFAEDPGRWKVTGHSVIPLEYFQGVTSDRQRDLYFDGLFTGLYRTDSDLHEEGRVNSAIPPEIFLQEGYNHIGDLTWDRDEGGRLLLPLECFHPIRGNTCRTGSIGVADPETLAWRYYVKLDPAFIPKAMWAEVSPNGKLLWTSAGSDLLAYRTADVNPANAAPDGPKLAPVVRLAGAVPPSGITGATFYKHRLFVAGQDTGPFQIWSIDLSDGSRRLEVELQVVGESEGLDIVKTLGGLLHWQVTPFRTGGRPPTFGFGHSALVHLVPVRGKGAPHKHD